MALGRVSAILLTPSWFCLPLLLPSLLLLLVWEHPKSHLTLYLRFMSLASLSPLAWEVIWRKDSFPSIFHLECSCECILSSSTGVDYEWDRWTLSDSVVDLAIGWSQCQFTCLTIFPRHWPAHLRSLDWELVKRGWGIKMTPVSELYTEFDPKLSFSSTRKTCLCSRDRKGKNGDKGIKKWLSLLLLVCLLSLSHPWSLSSFSAG